MAILGESFKPWVTKQVNTRQEKLSSFNKDNELLLYLNSTTAFVRLSSGINVGTDVLAKYGLPLDLAENRLAKKYVLEAARFDRNTYINGDFTSDVGYSSNNNNPSYGFLSSPEYGFVPPPGITQIDVKTLNRGTIREATISLVCHNITQLHVISILYLKLKYTLLLEWGHTVYYDNEGKLIQGFDIPNYSNEFLEKEGKTPNEILNELENNRQKSCGNYDAFFGWVKNFQWEVQENGTYNVTISAISTGDVIESLKINTNFDPNAKTEKDDNRYSKSTLHHILGEIRKNTDLNKRGFLNGYNTGEGSCLNTEALAKLSSRTFNYKEENDNNSVSVSNDILSEKEAIRIKFPNLQVTSNKDGKDIQSDQYYIKLGTLLRIIEAFVLVYDKTKNESSSKSNPPIFKLNHNFNTNECLTTVNQVPSDPRIALIPLSTKPKSGPMSNISTEYRNTKETDSYIAKTMHIYVNIDHIISTLDNSMDEKGNIPIYDFLTSLLNSISSALGGINTFEINYEDPTNTFFILDTALVPSKYRNIEDVAKINVNSFNPSNNIGGSFVTSFGLKTDIYSSIGNAIALGAQGGGSSLTAASTTYSSINTGIIDRTITEKTNANEPTVGDIEKERSASLAEKANIEKEFGNFITLLNSSNQKKALSPDDIDYYNYYIGSVLQNDLAIATRTGDIPGTIFIPVNLNLTVSGISGIRQYQVFTITENLLPIEYEESIQFITTTIEHKVDSKGWDTVINTLGVPYKKPKNPLDTPVSLLPKS